ncbi:BlaI/MecI/CopY family transcriptional regulator [Portibacter marinus]|uniref:BlaI/MecI/CopY family transcriptional regulator n=1 Tax=Portibacter marinus TaxID=2898660 RepID=UPI001F25C769|nr:BlaI/MecI/CopY family transcriptional regulator [Portibacter marinus]
MDKLTKTEEEIMQLFWEHGPSTVSQLIEKMPDPKPPHSTISTFVRILEKKNFVDHKAYGRTYEYFPLVMKNEYSKFSLKKLVGNYFDGSLNSLVSFLVKEEDLSLKDLSNIINDLKDEEQ